jgi:hypothetical protein
MTHAPGPPLYLVTGVYIYRVGAWAFSSVTYYLVIETY